jgi:hypothetical protein
MAETQAKSTFNQSEAVTRCRGYKESKLRGQYALAKMVDEEGNVIFLSPAHYLYTINFQTSYYPLCELG